jgi:hypothetical protein
MKLLLIVLLAFVPVALQAQGKFEKMPAKITFHVVTDEGKPVESAEVSVSTFDHWEPGDNFGRNIKATTKGHTDKDGNVALEFGCANGEIAYAAKGGPGFYETIGLQYQFAERKEGRWEPWNPSIDLVLKPKLNPVPMYARKLGVLGANFTLPAIDKEVGFDLVAGDWLPPHGTGKVADFVFKLERRYSNYEEPFEATLTLTFGNKGDGIQSVLAPPFVGSALKLPRYAPEHGYVAELVKRHARPARGAPVEASVREDQNYFFRVRTVLDKKGQVTSALYGKIDGDVQFWPEGGLQLTYYVNPASMDRNMEFDLKRNLFGQLPELQRPLVP